MFGGHRYLDQLTVADLATLRGERWGNITPYIVTPIVGPYTSIQAAIDAAQADGHEDTANPALVWVRPGVYVGDVALRRGIYVLGDATAPYSVRVVGTVTVDLSAGPPGDPALTTATSLIGVSILPTGAFDAFVFTGVNTQFCSLAFSAISCVGGGRALVLTNPALGSQLATLNLALEAGTPVVPVVDILAGQLLAAEQVWNPIGGGAGLILHVGAGGGLIANEILIAGNVVVDVGSGSVGFTEVLVNGGNITNNGTLFVRDATIIGAPLAPAILGAASTILLGPIGFAFGSSGFATPPTRVPGDGPLWFYVDATAPGTWGGPGVPADIQEAINRLATAVSGLLGGAIP